MIKRAGSNANNHATWLCTCECGGETVVSGAALRRSERRDGKVASVPSCGCLKRPRAAKSTSSPIPRRGPVPERWSVVERDGTLHLLASLGGREAVVDHDGTRWVCSECGPQQAKGPASEQCDHVIVVGRNLPTSVALSVISRTAARTGRTKPSGDAGTIKAGEWKSMAEVLAAGEAKRAERAKAHDEAFLPATPVVVRQMTDEDRAKLAAARARKARTFQQPERSTRFRA